MGGLFSKPNPCEMCSIKSEQIKQMKDEIKTLNTKVSINVETLNTDITEYLKFQDNMYFLPDDVEHKIILNFMLHYIKFKNII